jgi:hypothetical protein
MKEHFEDIGLSGMTLSKSIVKNEPVKQWTGSKWLGRRLNDWFYQYEHGFIF